MLQPISALPFDLPSQRFAPLIMSRQATESTRMIDLLAWVEVNKKKLLIGAAATAWNLSLLAQAERPEALRQAFRNANVRDVEAAAEVIVMLMRRKEQLFPDDRRTIVSWGVSESGGKCHVTVASLAV